MSDEAYALDHGYASSTSPSTSLRPKHMFPYHTGSVYCVYLHFSKLGRERGKSLLLARFDEHRVDQWEVEVGKNWRAGTGGTTPVVLLFLCSNWPQQTAMAPRSDFLLEPWARQLAGALLGFSTNKNSAR